MCRLKSVPLQFHTFVDVGWEAPYEHLAGVTLDALAVLVRETVRGAQAAHAVATSIVLPKPTTLVLHREQGRVTYSATSQR